MCIYIYIYVYTPQKSDARKTVQKVGISSQRLKLVLQVSMKLRGGFGITNCSILCSTSEACINNIGRFSYLTNKFSFFNFWFVQTAPLPCCSFTHQENRENRISKQLMTVDHDQQIPVFHNSPTPNPKP